MQTDAGRVATLNIDPTSETDRVYQLLKRQILSGERGPGSALRQEAIARDCETSRTPTREAVLRLAAEGLVVARSGKGAVVGDFTKENYLALSQVRCLVECYAVRRACRFMPSTVVEDLRSEIQEVLKSNVSTPSEVITVDQTVHRAIAEWSNNPILAGTIERLGEMNQMARGQDAAVHHAAILAGLEELLEAIEERNIERAHKLMYHHIIDFVVGASDLLDIRES